MQVANEFKLLNIKTKKLKKIYRIKDVWDYEQRMVTFH